MFIEKLDPLSTKDLRAVAILADVKNFHRAASLCSISQPALSSIIKKVESVLDTQLFRRSSRTFEITRQGQLVIEKIRFALSTLEEISDMTVAQPPLTSHFRLGFIPTIGPYYIPKLINPLLKAFPKLELSFTEATTERLTEMLIRREIDAAVAALPIHHPRIKQEPLFQEELALAVNESHVLARRTQVSINEIRHEDLLLMDQEHCLRGNAIESCGNEIQNARTVHSTSLETLLFMVQAGVGYTVVPEMATNLKYKSVKFMRFKGPAPTRRVGVAYLRTVPINQDVQALIDYLKLQTKSFR